MRHRAFYMSLATILTTTPLSGCMTAAAIHQDDEAREIARLRVFHAAEHDWALAPGSPVTGRLTLTASFRHGYGGVVQRIPNETLTCEGLPVRLIPDTPHMRWLIEWEYRLAPDARGDWRGSGGDPSGRWAWPEAASTAYVRETTCGRNGAFASPSTPAGRYLLLGQIHPTSDRASYSPPDMILKPVVVKAGEPLEVHIRSDDWLAGPLTPD